MRQRQSFGGFGLIFLVLILAMLAASWNRQNTYHEVQMSNQEFVTALENKEISQVIVRQNQQAPTGELEILLTNGEKKELYVPDVAAKTEVLEEAGVDFTTMDAVSYTHLDVYKRQMRRWLRLCRSLHTSWRDSCRVHGSLFRCVLF